MPVIDSPMRNGMVYTSKINMKNKIIDSVVKTFDDVVKVKWRCKLCEHGNIQTERLLKD